ncbi:MAG: type III secretion system chaperone [Pseudomonadota bacterium]
MDRDDVQKLLADFGRTIGLDSLSLDDTGRLTLRIDDAFTVDIEHDDEEDIILLAAELTRLGAEPERERLLELLRGNLFFDATEGATLALDGTDNLVVLQRTMRLEGLVVGEIARVLEIFIATAETWKDRLAQPSAIEHGDEPQPTSRFDDKVLRV